MIVKETTRYFYENAIKEKQKEIERLSPYRMVALRIYDAVQQNANTSNGINQAWLLAQFRELFR